MRRFFRRIRRPSRPQENTGSNPSNGGDNGTVPVTPPSTPPTIPVPPVINPGPPVIPVPPPTSPNAPEIPLPEVTPNPPVTVQPPATTQPAKGQFSIMGYYTQWSIYARAYSPADMPVNLLSHILYAFANIAADGTVGLTDSWADTDKRFPSDSWSEPPTNVFGNFKQLGLLKKRNPTLKVCLSIGGWTFSGNFATVAADPSRRTRFIQTSLALLNDLGLDGLDIDWEFPASNYEGAQYLLLLQECRTALTAYAASKSDITPYLLSCAMPAGTEKSQRMPLGRMAEVVDTFNVMTYDYRGAWDPVTGHQANLHPAYPGDTSGATAVKDFLAAGVPSHKIIFGIPLYGRSFLNSDDKAGSQFSTAGGGTWEAGVYDYKSLPLPGMTEVTDRQLVAATCYDSAKREWVSFDNVEVVRIKSQWAAQQGLGGVMFWEMSADRVGAGSLIKTSVDALGGQMKVDSTPNHRNFPSSRYGNVRQGFV